MNDRALSLVFRTGVGQDITVALDAAARRQVFGALIAHDPAEALALMAPVLNVARAQGLARGRELAQNVVVHCNHDAAPTVNVVAPATPKSEVQRVHILSLPTPPPTETVVERDGHGLIKRTKRRATA